MKKLILALLLITSIAVGATNNSVQPQECGEPFPNSDGSYGKVCRQGTTFTLYKAPCYYCVYVAVFNQNNIYLAL